MITQNGQSVDRTVSVHIMTACLFEDGVLGGALPGGGLYRITSDVHMAENTYYLHRNLSWGALEQGDFITSTKCFLKYSTIQ